MKTTLFTILRVVIVVFSCHEPFSLTHIAVSLSSFLCLLYVKLNNSSIYKHSATISFTAGIATLIFYLKTRHQLFISDCLQPVSYSGSCVKICCLYFSVLIRREMKFSLRAMQGLSICWQTAGFMRLKVKHMINAWWS